MELKLQAEDSFVLKVVQLEELLQVRHSVFVIGNAGSGKSQARHQHLPVVPAPPLHPVTHHPYSPTCLPEAPPLTYSCLLALLEALANPGGWHRVTPVALTLAYSEPYSEPVKCLTIYLQGRMLSLLPRPISEDRETRETAQLVQCLPHKHRDPAPRTT